MPPLHISGAEPGSNDIGWYPRHTPHEEEAAALGAKALSGGLLTDFEKACDNALSAYLDAARLIPFGEAPVLAYLAARETEYTNLRIVLMGRMAGVPADVIRSRLRAGYV